MSHKLKHILITGFLVMWTTFSFGNNITFSNLSIVSQNISSHQVVITFNVQWENSWRVSVPPNNWDAAWIFVKYRIGTGNWNHAYLNNTGHIVPVSSAISIGLLFPGTPYNNITNPGIGAFLYRNVDGAGTFSLSDVQLLCNLDPSIYNGTITPEIQVFGIEMVYVPQGSFYLGSTGGSFSELYTYPTLASSYLINDESEINVGNTAGKLYYKILSWTHGGDQLGPIPATFPKGYNAFYCMKHEISQQGYVDFLNTLTRTQQTIRVATAIPVGTSIVTNRYVMCNDSVMHTRVGIRCDSVISANDPIHFYCDFNGNGIGGETGDGIDIACGDLSWADVIAYLDWSGLRPMTELEFEKACRGPIVPVKNEYAWGSINMIYATGILNSGESNEIASDNNANTVINNDASGTNGPLRVGSFAKSNSTREQSGATYYGILDMTGNLWDRTVTIGDPVGRAFAGYHGNGQLSLSGESNVNTWPGIDGVGAGFKGGSWAIVIGPAKLSDRQYAAHVISNRLYRYGGRGIRSAP